MIRRDDAKLGIKHEQRLSYGVNDAPEKLRRLTHLLVCEFDRVDILQRQHDAFYLVVLRPIRHQAQLMPVAFEVLDFARPRLEALEHFRDPRFEVVLSQARLFDVPAYIGKRTPNIGRDHLQQLVCGGSETSYAEVPIKHYYR